MPSSGSRSFSNAGELMSVTRNRYRGRAYEDSGKSGEEKVGQVDAVIQ